MREHCYVVRVTERAHKKALTEINATGLGDTALTDRGQAGEAFEERIRAMMKTAKLSTIEALVERSGIERGRWYRWFAGKSVPRRSTLRRIAPLIGMTYDELAEPWGELIEAAGSGNPELGAALIDQISALVTELALTRREQAEWNRGVADVLQALGDRAFGAPTDDPAFEPPANVPPRPVGR